MGKTRPKPAQWRARRKHPHACGEDLTVKKYLDAQVETPPRLWGRRVGNDPNNCYTGNTPTPVGKTTPKGRAWRPWWKHPHACGEDTRVRRSMYLLQETPPRLWGRQARVKRPRRLTGNTPTPVGKTSRSGFINLFNGKHPHACGEDNGIYRAFSRPLMFLMLDWVQNASQ